MSKNKPVLSEDDLVSVFSYGRKGQGKLERFFSILSKALLIMVSIVVIYGVINFYAVRDKFLLWYRQDYKTESPETKNTVVTESPTQTSDPIPDNLPLMVENTIDVPALSIVAPITWRVDNTPDEVSAALEKGTIQLAGTSLPGQKGNIYITGHSSNYVWAKGDYNSVFATIGKLVVGDQIFIRFSSQTYAYTVTDQKIVSPSDLSVLAPTEDSRLTLVTCWPVGTSLKRIVVVASQIYPNPNKNTAASGSIDMDRLTGGL